MDKFKLAIAVAMILLSFNVFADVRRSNDGGISIENQNYLIDWDLEVTGYSPHSGKFILEGSNLMSKGIDRTVDVAIISSVQFETGSKIYLLKEEIVTYQQPRSYICRSSYYGWNNPEHTEVYCNITSPIINNETEERVTTTEIIQLPETYEFETHPNYAVITWNEELVKTIKKKTDVTDRFSFTNHSTPYGNFIYYVNDVLFKADKDYGLTFELNIDKSLLPVKYTVCFGNFESGILYFCLDPEITDARTWTTAADFNNGTYIENLTISDKIELGSFDDGPKSFYNYSSNFKDYEGRLDLTAVSSPTIVSGGKMGNAVEYTADSLDELSMGNNPQIWHGFQWNDTTIWGWAKSTSYNFGVDNSMNLISASPDGAGSCTHNQFKIYVGGSCDNGGCDSSAYIRVVMNSYTDAGASNGSRSVRTSTGLLPAEGNWFFWAVVHDDAPGDGGRVDVYIDGVLVNSSTFTHDIDSYTKSNDPCEHTIGSRPGNADSGWTDTWDGKLDEIGIFEEALNSEQIELLYNNSHGVTEPIELYAGDGLFSDRQGWYPVSGDRISSISIVSQIQNGTNIQFRYNVSNSSLDTSTWINVASGTDEVNLYTEDDDLLYYQFRLMGSSSVSPYITSYTIFEEKYISTESDAKAAILAGIQQSSIWPGASIYTDQKVFLKSLNSQNLGTVDKMATYGNQRWLINFGNSSSGFFNITPIIYSLDIVNSMYSSELSELVKDFIDGTVS